MNELGGGNLKYASSGIQEGCCGDYHLVGTETEKEAKRKEIKQRLTNRIERHREFLREHPYFRCEDIMRNQIAKALFDTDKPNEAWQEVEVLSKMGCNRRAEEARELLLERKKLLVDSSGKEKVASPKEDTILK